MQNKVFDQKQFKCEGEEFLTSLLQDMEAAGFSVQGLSSDHLCFRVESSAEYEFYKAALLSVGRLLTEALVNGRPICTFKLNQPFQVGSHTVPLVELPAPKPGANYATGFEHAEFLINESFDVFSARYPGLNFTQSGNKSLNPELCVKLPRGQVKFHHHSLETVIAVEEAKLSDLIFDLDGTLIASRETIYEINRIVFSEALERTVTLEEAKSNFHPEFSKLFEAFQLNCPLKQKAAVDRWGEVSETFKFELFRGMKEMLYRLRDFGYRLHLWTARDENSGRSILRDHGIDGLFVTTSFATEVDSKPHSKSLKFDWNQAKANSFIVIGDSATDMRGAANVNAIRAAALWDPSVNAQALVAEGAHIFFHSVQELEGWLMRS
ncbi:VOC family protein [Bdellovibrio sp. HCB2-146]|uniref:VOC family protein n=1 Tax=Bdellovibrio sp. HCB2-146 TaxID=3394362 RepID=UPI0039BD41A8